MKIRSLMNLRGRSALVTGATGHLGRLICETFAEMGANLILVDLPETPLAKHRHRLQKKWNIKCRTFPCNLECEKQRQAMIKAVKSEFRKINILVNNAAFTGTANLPGWNVPFQKQNLSTWRRAMEVNLTAIFHLCQGFAPKMKNAKGANILNIGSIYAESGPDWTLYKGTNMGNPAAYASSKGGLVQLTRYLATTLAPKIRVNTVSPGGIRRNQPRSFVQKYEKKNPLKRMAHESDIMGAVLFLTSDLSQYVTGINLKVDGGWGV